MDKKRKFRIEGGTIGGEFVIGTVSVDFVKYWQEREGELIEHLESIYHGKEGDANSPPMCDGKNFPWNECDDIEHILSQRISFSRNSSVSSIDTEDLFKVTEIITDINEKQVYSGSPFRVYGREIYTSQINKDNENPDHDVSLLISLKGERGFDEANSWLVETDGEDFNPKKLAYGVLETNVGEFLDSVFYDKKELEVDYAFTGSESHNSYSAKVGTISSSWIKDHSKTNALKKIDWWEYDELLKA